MKPKVQRKMKSSAIDGGGKATGNTDEFKNTQPLDHWAFLEDIEAPMWADLNSCNLPTTEIDDEWFHVTHPFHQCSSRQLISFFHSGEVGQSNISIQEPPSPMLPPSVSRSRGKSYISKEWGDNKSKATISDKQHPLNILVMKSSGKSGSCDESKSMSRTGKLNERPKACSSCESCLTDTSEPKFSRFHSNSLAIQEGESSSISTVTTDCNDLHQKKNLEVSSQTLSQTSGLLSSLRISLRRSCATRPPARVEVNGGRRSEGRKSSSSKSSVGSSSHPSSLDRKSTLKGTWNKERTRDGTNFVRISQPPMNKLKVPTSAVDRQDTSIARRGNDSLASKVTAKGKVKQHPLQVKVLMPRKINEQYQVIAKPAEKVGVGRVFDSQARNKENGSRTMAASQKSKSTIKAAQCLGHVTKTLNQGMLQKIERKKLSGLKEKTNSRNRDKESVNASQKVYFR